MRGRRFVLLCVASLGGFANYALLLSVVPLWVVAGGAGDAGAGATIGVLMLTTVLTQLTVPWLLRRLSHRLVLGAGAALLGVPAFAYAGSADLAPVLAVSALRGVGFGVITVAGAALLARMIPPPQHGRAVGVYGIAVGTPTLTFLPGGVWLAQHAGFAATFALGGLLPVVAGSAIIAMGGETAGRTDHGSGAGPVAEPGLDSEEPPPRPLSALAGPWTVMTGVALATGGLYTFLPLAVAPAGSWIAPAALLAFGTANLLGRWATGVAGDRFGRGRLLVPGVVTAGVGLLGPAAASDLRSAGAAGAVGAAAVAGAALYGLGFGTVQNETLVAMFGRAGPGGYGMASAAWNIAYDAGTGLGAVALGFVVGGLGYAAAFAAAAATVAACLPVALATVRRARRGRRLPLARDRAEA